MIRSLSFLIIFCLRSFSAENQIVEKQLTLSSFIDSNPRENIDDTQSVFGLKARGLIRFDETQEHSRLYGSLLGQGFYEPGLFLDSKLIMNAELGGQYVLASAWRLDASVKSFQKLYFEDIQRSGRTTLDMAVQHSNVSGLKQRVGISQAASHIQSTTLFKYTDRQGYLSLSQGFTPRLSGEISFQLSQVDYHNYAARELEDDSLFYNNSEDQKDQSWLMGLHVRYTGKFICGASLSYEDVSSNSSLDEARILAAKLYLSGRLSQKIFIHVVLQGMNKYYEHTLSTEVNHYRDPEENIQNQLHLQLERVFSPKRLLYVQYSYIKNETVFNHWFYNKSLIETGIKFTL